MEDQESGLFSLASKLGKATGLIAAILLTPVLFQWISPLLYRYLVGSYGADVGAGLLWGIGAIGAFVIYFSVSVVTSFMLVWVLAWFAARGFGR